MDMKTDMNMEKKKGIVTVAERRMFTKKITESDAFLDMPSSTQMLYFHLSMNADDDGFVNNPRRIQRMCGASDDDFKLLALKSFILTFENGIIVIKHWKMHNYIQSDRYKPTDYIAEKSQLGLEHNKAYTLDEKKMEIKCASTLNVLEKGFIPPSVFEIEKYCKERKNEVNPQAFFDYYTEKNWEINGGKMKNWKAVIRGWEFKNGRTENRKDTYDKEFYKEFE